MILNINWRKIKVVFILNQSNVLTHYFEEGVFGNLRRNTSAARSALWQSAPLLLSTGGLAALGIGSALSNYANMESTRHAPSWLSSIMDKISGVDTSSLNNTSTENIPQTTPTNSNEPVSSSATPVSQQTQSPLSQNHSLTNSSLPSSMSNNNLNSTSQSSISNNTNQNTSLNSNSNSQVTNNTSNSKPPLTPEERKKLDNIKDIGMKASYAGGGLLVGSRFMSAGRQFKNVVPKMKNDFQQKKMELTLQDSQKMNNGINSKTSFLR